MFQIFAPEQVSGLPVWPVVVVVVGLIALNIINNRIAPTDHMLLWAIGASLGFLAIGLLDGNSWTDMGLGWYHLLPGLFWGLGCIGLVTVVYVVAASLKATRKAFQDERISEMSAGKVVFQALVEVPFGTVLLEEIAFRAVLFSMLARRVGVVWAIVISSVIFGLWHILPSMGTNEQNAALGAVAGQGRRGNIIAICLSVVTTTVAGALFAGLRLVSGSVLAPMGLHWATNGMGYAFSWFIIRARKRRHLREQDDPSADSDGAP